jgi:flagellar biogenesis protein FliO
MEGQCVDQQTCVLSITEQSIHLLNHLSASEEDDNGWNLNQSESYSDDDDDDD